MTTVYKTGNRTSRISISSSLSITHGSISNWINGSDSQDASGSFFPNAISDNTGLTITFNFGTPTLVDEARVRQSGSAPVLNVTRGNWQWQGWDGASWVNIGSPFTLGGSASQTLTELNSNTVDYSIYRMLGVGGAVSDSGWMGEIELKEAVLIVNAYCDPINNPTIDFTKTRIFNSAKPIELVPIIPHVYYVSNSPPYLHVAKSADILNCLAGDYIEAILVQEATWDFSPNNIEWAGMLMLRRITDSGSVNLPNAGPTIDFRCMSENPGKNILVAEHHALMTLIGATKIELDGDYRVDYLTYCSMGTIVGSGTEHLKMHDGTFLIKRFRA